MNRWAIFGCPYGTPGAAKARRPGLSYFAPMGLKTAQDSWHISLLDNKIPKYFSEKDVGNDKGVSPMA